MEEGGGGVMDRKIRSEREEKKKSIATLENGNEFRIYYLKWGRGEETKNSVMIYDVTSGVVGHLLKAVLFLRSLLYSGEKAIFI